MSTNTKIPRVDKLKTGIPGFDSIASGGLPKGRTTLVTGSTGSAKTVLAIQFLAEGIIKANESGVFVTFKESPANIRRNMTGFGWDIEEWETEGKWAFVDVSPEPGHNAVVVGEHDFGALLARIEHAVGKVSAKRVVMDSLGALFTQFANKAIVRSELLRIASALKTMDVTAIVTVEQTKKYGNIARYGIEEFIADNVIILRNALGQEKRRRTVEILKLRGTSHQKGEYPFTLMPGEGIIVIPPSDIELKQRPSN